MDKPIIFYEGKYSEKDITDFRKAHKIWEDKDIFDSQKKELAEIKSPKKSGNGDWVYFPWNGVLLHTVNEKESFTLRTNRNRNLIKQSEQRDLYDSCIGVAGLSVGAGVAVGLSYQGISKNLKLAEFDTLETTNLNRVRASVSDVGEEKLNIAAKQIYEINPYANLLFFEKGLTEEELKKFVTGKPKPKLIFEIIDNFEMKIKLRLVARKAGIPVIMMANLGDRVLIDIERYDLDKKLKLFNGLLGDFPEKVLENPDEDPNKYAVRIVGISNVPQRAIDSVKEIGKTLVGRPQLSSTVTISGAIGTYIAKKIFLGDKKLSGRILLDLDKVFQSKVVRTSKA